MDQQSQKDRDALKNRIFDIDFKKYSMQIKTQEEREQLQRIKTKIDMVAKAYNEHDFLRDQMRIQTEKHKKMIKKITTAEATYLLDNEILKRCEQFYNSIETKGSEHEIAEELKQKCKNDYKKKFMRQMGIASYSILSLFTSYLMYRKFMKGNKLMFGISYIFAGIIPSLILLQSATEIFKMFIS